MDWVPAIRHTSSPMGQSSTTFHEATDVLQPKTRDMHRAIVSLMEELEAIDWYNQRVDAAGDDGLRAVLAHNRDEEKEHAAMVLEWIRRHDEVFARHLKTYLFTDGPIVGIEKAMEARAESGADDGGSGSGYGAGGRPGATVGALRAVRR